MEPENLPPLHKVPPIRAESRKLLVVVSVASSIISISLLFVPRLAGFENYPRLLTTIALVLILVAVVSPFYPWIKETGVALFGRSVEYPDLRQQASRESEQLHALRNEALGLVRVAASYADEGNLLTAEEKFNGLKQKVVALGTSVWPDLAYEIGGASVEKIDCLSY